MSKVARFSFVAFLVLSIGAIVMAQSQASSGQIVGTVTNPNGEVVPGATIVVTNPAIGLARTLTTGEQGDFRAVSLPPGDYTIEVTAQGFGKSTQTGYKVEVGSALTADITLGVQAVSAEVLVSAGSSVETTQVQTTTNISGTMISQLPINGRRFTDFVLGTPTAQIDPQRGQISLVGQRGINGNVQIDGADYNNPFFGGYRGGERAAQAMNFPQEGVREFQVVASGFNAEFGRSTGGIINVVTKSGTNDFHGAGFYLIRPAKYAHKNAFGQVAAPTQKQFGGAVGGPFPIPRFGEGGPSYYGGKDKSFFFVSYEQQKANQERAVLFERLPLVNPATTTGIAEAFNFYRSQEGPYAQTNDARAFLTRLDFNFSDKNQASVRYNYSTNTAANAVTAGTSLQATTPNALSQNGTEGDRQHTVVGQLTTFFSGNVINELRAQYSRENRPRLANELSPRVATTVGTFGTVSFLPTTEYDTRKQVADNLTYNLGQHSFKFGGDYNRTFASQLFAFNQTGGFTFSGLGGADAGTVATVLRILTVGSSGAGDSANRFDDIRSQYIRATGNGLASLGSTELAFFGQDSWRIRSNLTLSYGLRYEAQFMPTPDTNNSALTNLIANANFPIGRVDPRVIPNQTRQFAPRVGFAWDPTKDGRTVIRGYAGVYYARFPLLSLADPINNFRTPPGNVSLQLSGFTTTSPGTACANVNNAGCPNTTYKQFLSIGIDLNQFTLGSMPILSVAQLQQINQNISTARGITFNPSSGLTLATAGAGLKNPRSFQWGAAFERELRNGLTVGATFDYINTVHLNRNRDYDLPTPFIRSGDLSQRPFFGLDSATRNGTGGTPNDQLLRPIREIGNFGYVQVRESSARSLYRALTLRTEYRTKRSDFNAFYVLSKSLDDDSTERNASFAEYDNAFNLKPEYGFARLDRRHQFSFGGVFRVPFGFQVSSTGRLASGSPIDVSVSGIIAPTDFRTDITSSNVPANQTAQNVRNGAYAALVTLARLGTPVVLLGGAGTVTVANTTGDLNQDRGNFSDRPYTAPGVSLPRNAFRNKPIYNTNIRIQRDFHIGEKFEISPSFEVFNLFKFKNIQLSSTTATNYGNPGVNERTGEMLNPSNPNFLRIRDFATGDYLLTNNVASPLQMQFGVRVKF
ncbi:MAG: carboxypeptidase regulatory-like domain-containing protein [Pyrinomonadaceae bacterium]